MMSRVAWPLLALVLAGVLVAVLLKGCGEERAPLPPAIVERLDSADRTRPAYDSAQDTLARRRDSLSARGETALERARRRAANPVSDVEPRVSVVARADSAQRQHTLAAVLDSLGAARDTIAGLRAAIGDYETAYASEDSAQRADSIRADRAEERATAMSNLARDVAVAAERANKCYIAWRVECPPRWAIGAIAFGAGAYAGYKLRERDDRRGSTTQANSSLLAIAY